MKMRWLAGAALTGMLVAPAISQEKQEAKQEGGHGEMTPEQRAWMEAGTPNENHTRLKYAIGKWSCTVTSWESGAEPVQSTGKSESESIFDGRYVATRFKGEFEGGQFEGHGLIGYDNLKKKYFSAWIDSMSTGVFSEYGEYDEATKTFTYTGKMDGPLGKTYYTKSTIKIESKDRHVMTMYRGESPDKLERVLKVIYERDTEAARAG